MQIDAFVVIPLPLGRPNTVSDEDDLPTRRDVGFGPFPPRDERVAVDEALGRASRLAPRQRWLGRHSDKRDRLEVRPVRAGGLESQRLELRRDVCRRELSASRRGRPAFQEIAREETQMGVHRGRVDRNRCGLLRRCRGRHEYQHRDSMPTVVPHGVPCSGDRRQVTVSMVPG